MKGIAISTAVQWFMSSSMKLRVCTFPASLPSLYFLPCLQQLFCGCGVVFHCGFPCTCTSLITADINHYVFIGQQNIFLREMSSHTLCLKHELLINSKYLSWFILAWHNMGTTCTLKNTAHLKFHFNWMHSFCLIDMGKKTQPGQKVKMWMDLKQSIYFTVLL